MSYWYNKLKVGRMWYLGDGLENVAKEMPSGTDLNKLDGLGTTAAEFNYIDASVNAALMAPGAGITSGTGTVWKCAVTPRGGMIKTEIMIDLTGLNSSATGANYVIGDATPGTGKAHIGRVTAAVNGTVWGVKMRCLETPAGGDDDINLYSATEDTGTEESDIAALTETLIINSGDLTSASTVYGGAIAANEYLYLTGGTGDKNATYTAGQLLITLYGVTA